MKNLFTNKQKERIVKVCENLVKNVTSTHPGATGKNMARGMAMLRNYLCELRDDYDFLEERLKEGGK